MGQKIAREIFGIPFKQKSDISIISSYPADLDLWQASKALHSREIITKNGGSIILVSSCPEGISASHPRLYDYVGQDPDSLLRKIQIRKVQDRIGAIGGAIISTRKRRLATGIVSGGLREKEIIRMGFQYFDCVDAAVKSKLREYGNGARISVLTHGGESVPLKQLS